MKVVNFSADLEALSIQALTEATDEKQGDVMIATNSTKGFVIGEGKLQGLLLQLRQTMKDSERGLHLNLQGFFLNTFLKDFVTESLHQGLLVELIVTNASHATFLSKILVDKKVVDWKYLTLEFTIIPKDKKHREPVFHHKALQLGEALARNTFLQGLRLHLPVVPRWYDKANDSQDLARRLAIGLARNQHLQALSLSGWELPESTILITNLPSTLQRLHIEGLSISPKLSSTASFLRAWKPIWKLHENLVDLHLSFSVYIPTESFLTTTEMPHLQSLTLQFEFWPGDILLDDLLLNLQCPKLNRLNFSLQAKMPGDLDWMARFIESGNLPELKSVWFPPRCVVATSRNLRLLYLLLAKHHKFESLGPHAGMPPCHDLLKQLTPITVLPQWIVRLDKWLSPQDRAELLWKCFQKGGLVPILLVPWRQIYPDRFPSGEIQSTSTPSSGFASALSFEAPKAEQVIRQFAVSIMPNAWFSLSPSTA